MIQRTAQALRRFLTSYDIYIVMVCAVILFNVFIHLGQVEEPLREFPVRMETTLQERFSDEALREHLQGKPFFEILFFVVGLCGTGVFLLGLVYLGRLIRRALRARSLRALIPSRLNKVPWGLEHIIKSCIVLVFIGYVLNFCEGIVLAGLRTRQFDENLFMLINTVLMDIGIVGIMFYFIKKVHHSPFVSLGFHSRTPLADIKTGLRGYITIIPVLAVVLSLTSVIVKAIQYEIPPQPIFDIFFEETDTRMLTASFLFVIFLGPLVEEMFFRGFLYPALRARTGRLLGMMISAALFSALHTNLVGFAPIFILGMLLAFLYERTGSLFSSLSVHILHNGLVSSFVICLKAIGGA
ncbi:MAG: CPBP family intramembrane metalloprotease [Candidatus Omnitrophica bacterium]|nr:CPBP family intramembrane metalloprotease [Candidatus Omnitrophota bacterium]